MNSKNEKLVFQLRILRALVVGSWGQLQNVENGIKSLWNANDIARVGSLTHKMKTRGDSVRVLLQTINDGAVAGPAVIALAESVLNFATLIKAIVEDLVGQQRIDEYASVCLRQIEKFDANLARVVEFGDTTINADASRLVHVLRTFSPADVALYYSVSAACNFASGIQVDPQGMARIVREIKFPPEYQQAGLSILNYFSSVLEDRYPAVAVGISIQQYQDKVTLLITLPDGSQEVVEKVLTEYGLVVAGKMSPHDFLPDQMRALALQQKLELAQMEVRQTRDLLRLQEKYSSSRIESLEQDVKRLYSLLGQELSSKSELQKGFIELALHSQNDKLHPQLSLLLEKLSGAIDSRDEQHTKVLLEDIREADPDVFSRISMYLYESAATGIIGSVAFDWIKVILSAFPK